MSGRVQHLPISPPHQGDLLRRQVIQFVYQAVNGGVCRANLALEQFAGVGRMEVRIDPKWQQGAVPGVARK